MKYEEEGHAVVEIALGDSSKIETLEEEERSIVDCIECDSCVICLCEFEHSDLVTILPCRHIYHKECIEP